MDSPLRISLKDYCINQNEPKKSLKASQLKLLNLNQLTKSHATSNQSKTDRTSNKLNYRYQRVNNSFRLVQVDLNDGQNKQNYQQTKLESKIDRNSHILMTINSLSDRVQKLERNQNFDEQKKQFNMHKIVEKLISQNNNTNFSKYSHTIEKKLQQTQQELIQIKNKLKSVSILPSLSDNENNLIKKCKNMINQQLSKQITNILKQFKEQLQVPNKNFIKQSEQLKIQVENAAKRMNRQLQSRLQQSIKCVQLKTLQMQANINKYGQSQDKIWSEVFKINGQIAQSKLKLLTSSNLRTRCQKQITNYIYLEILFGKLQSKQKINNISYGVDPEGYLVDSEGYYLLDVKGEMIKLTNSQLTKLKDVGVFYKKQTF